MQYLLQTDPNIGAPARLNNGQPAYSFDLGLVGAVGMKELIQTCGSGAHMSAIIRSLLLGNHGDPLRWKSNGPGVGWEMRTAWSGLFGRFFARAYMEAKGYTEFHALQRGYDQVTNNLAVSRLGAGEIADWICAKSAAGMDGGEVVIVEAKGRHREGNGNLFTLPRPLQTALAQIANTVVWRRNAAGGMEPHSVKGYAILSKWTNETKGIKTRSLLRVVDPDTPGYKTTDEEREQASLDVQSAHIASLLSGLGLPDLGIRTNPLKPLSPNEVSQNLSKAATILTDRTYSQPGGEQRVWVSGSDIGLKSALATRYRKSVEREYRRYAELSGSWSQQHLEEAIVRSTTPVEVVRVNATEGEYVGSVFGINGRVDLPLNETIAATRRLPDELKDQFIFVGLRTSSVERALRRELLGNKGLQRLYDAQAFNGFSFGDGSIIAPLSDLEPLERVAFEVD